MARLSGVDLRKWYGQREVVRGVSPEVNQGEIVGLLGPNGAGKTTSFYMLTGIIKPSSGRVLLEEQDIGTWPLHERARVGISYLPQESSVFRKLTVRQNLQIILEHTGLSRKEQKERADVLLEDFGLTRLEKSHAMHLSGGERRRLEIAVRLSGNRNSSFSTNRLLASTLLRWVISKVWCAPCVIAGSEFSSLTTMSVKH